MAEDTKNIARKKRPATMSIKKEDQVEKKANIDNSETVSELDYLINLYKKTPTKWNSKNHGRLVGKGLIGKNGNPLFNEDLVKNFFIKKLNDDIGSKLYIVYDQLKSGPEQTAAFAAIDLKKLSKSISDKIKNNTASTSNDYDLLFAVLLILKAKGEDSEYTARQINAEIFGSYHETQRDTIRRVLSTSKSGFFIKKETAENLTFTIDLEKMEHFILEKSYRKKGILETLVTAYNIGRNLINNNIGNPKDSSHRETKSDSETLDQSLATTAETHPAIDQSASLSNSDDGEGDYSVDSEDDNAESANLSTSPSGTAETKGIKSNNKRLEQNSATEAQARPTMDPSASSNNVNKAQDGNAIEIIEGDAEQNIFSHSPTNTAGIKEEVDAGRSENPFLQDDGKSSASISNTLETKRKHEASNFFQTLRVKLLPLITRRHDRFSFNAQKFDNFLRIEFLSANEVAMTTDDIRTELVGLCKLFDKSDIDIKSRKPNFSNWTLTIEAEPAVLENIMATFKQIEREASRPAAAATQAPNAAMFSTPTSLRSVPVSQRSSSTAPEAGELVTEATCVVQ